MWIYALLYNLGSVVFIALAIFFASVFVGVFLRAEDFSPARVRFACSFLAILVSFGGVKFLHPLHALFLALSSIIAVCGVVVGFEKPWERLKRFFFRMFRFRQKENDGIPAKGRL